MRTTKWLCVGLVAVSIVFGAAVAGAQGDELLVYQVQAAQLPGTTRVDVWYKLHTVGGAPVVVTLSLSTDSGATYPYLCEHVTGDVGEGVLPGTDKHIVWDAGVAMSGLSSTTCRLRVTADDGVDEIPEGFVAIPAGTFTMGSPTDEPGHESGETQHQVTLTHGIYVQTTEVTNQQYRDLAQWAYDHGHVTATSASLRDNLDGSTQELLDLDGYYCEISFSGGLFAVDAGKENHPVLEVTWYGSVAYCDWLSLQQGLPRAYNHSTWQCNNHDPYNAQGYRLPTEAEWEYACRAGSTTAFANGPITHISCSPLDPNLDMMGWYCGNADGWTHPVAQKLPNAWGLYDMHGNLYEWCNDWYASYGGAVTDPVGPGTGSYRMVRGGFWDYGALYCRSALRDYNYPSYSYDDIGFRPARSAL